MHTYAYSHICVQRQQCTVFDIYSNTVYNNSPSNSALTRRITHSKLKNQREKKTANSEPPACYSFSSILILIHNQTSYYMPNSVRVHICIFIVVKLRVSRIRCCFFVVSICAIIIMLFLGCSPLYHPFIQIVWISLCYLLPLNTILYDQSFVPSVLSLFRPFFQII